MEAKTSELRGPMPHYEVHHKGGVKKHEHIGSALMHIAKLHDPEADHMHVHATEDEITTHHVANGKMHGPDTHAEMEQAADHMESSLE